MDETIDNKAGTVNVYKLLPQPGDAIIITNCGTHFEIKHMHVDLPPLYLTDEDIEILTQGRMVWH